MRALVCRKGSLELCTRELPALKERTALVRVKTAGVCNTDLELVRGYMGFCGVLGHEFVGTVVRGPEEWHGVRVVGEINFACQRCATCRSGMGRHCRTRRVMGILNADGAFADFVAVPTANLHRVPDTVPDDEAVFVEPLAAACEILEQVTVRSRMACTVIGDGKLGLLVAQVLHHAGGDVLVVGHHADHLDFLRARGVATVLADNWNKERAELVVEATGTPAGFADAVAATLPRGTLVLKTTVADPVSVHLAPVVIDEITVVGSRCGPFAPALQLLETRKVQVRPLIAARFPLTQAVEALRTAAIPGTLKVLIDVEAEEGQASATDIGPKRR